MEADHVGVAGDADPEPVGEARGEVVAGAGAERLAGAEPDQRVRLEPVAQRLEAAVQRVARRQRAGVERLAVDARDAPRAVPPELQLGDRPVALLQPCERLAPARNSDRVVEPTGRAIEPAAGRPRRAQADRSAPAGAVMDQEAVG